MKIYDYNNECDDATLQVTSYCQIDASLTGLGLID